MRPWRSYSVIQLFSQSFSVFQLLIYSEVGALGAFGLSANIFVFQYLKNHFFVCKSANLA